LTNSQAMESPGAKQEVPEGLHFVAVVLLSLGRIAVVR
jgi:hypothetical protein